MCTLTSIKIEPCEAERFGQSPGEKLRSRVPEQSRYGLSVAAPWQASQLRDELQALHCGF